MTTTNDCPSPNESLGALRPEVAVTFSPPSPFPAALRPLRGEPSRSAVTLLVALAFGVACGCRTTTYRARSLPPEIVAQSRSPHAVARANSFGASPGNQDIIYPGDTLRIVVDPGDNSEKLVPVDLLVGADGTVVAPLIGPVQVGGLTLPDASRAIYHASRQRDVYRDPSVHVLFAQRRMNRVTVLGAVREPGEHNLLVGGSTLAAALAAAGGVTEKAGAEIEIRQSTPALAQGQGGQVALTSHRGGFGASAQAMKVNINDMAANPTINPFLQDGAVIHVIEQPAAYITVMGLTGNRTMEIPRNRDYRLLDALADAGGLHYSDWIADKVTVIRKVPGKDETVTIRASVRKAKDDRAENLVLAEWDVVSVEETPLTFTLGTFGRFLGMGVQAATGAAYLR